MSEPRRKESNLSGLAYFSTSGETRQVNPRASVSKLDAEVISIDRSRNIHTGTLEQASQPGAGLASYRLTAETGRYNLNVQAPITPSGDVMTDPTRDDQLLEAKLGKAAAETDTKIARLEGKLDLVLEAVKGASADARDNRRAIIANGWVIFGALVVVLGIMVTVAPVIFDMGFKWRETISREIQDRIPTIQHTPPPSSAR